MSSSSQPKQPNKGQDIPKRAGPKNKILQAIEDSRRLEEESSFTDPNKTLKYQNQIMANTQNMLQQQAQQMHGQMQYAAFSYQQAPMGYIMTPAGMLPMASMPQGAMQLIPGVNQPVFMHQGAYPTQMAPHPGMSPQDYLELQKQQIYSELEQLRTLDGKVQNTADENGVNREMKKTDDFLNKYNPGYTGFDDNMPAPTIGDSLMFGSGADSEHVRQKRQQELLASLQKLDELYFHKLEHKPIPFLDHYTPMRKKQRSGQDAGNGDAYHDDAIEWGDHKAEDLSEDNDETVARALAANNYTKMMGPQGYLQKKKQVEEQRATIAQAKPAPQARNRPDQASAREQKIVETEHGVLKVNKAQLQNLLD